MRVRARPPGALVEVMVEDEGPGIPDAKLEGIFDRFYSERPHGERFGQHSGLGLSICRQIVEGLRGRIAAENRRDAEGKVLGARFIVRLPAGYMPRPRGGLGSVQTNGAAGGAHWASGQRDRRQGR